MTAPFVFEISAFVERRAAALGLDLDQVADQLGIQSSSLAQRRLRSIMDGFIVSNEHLLPKLQQALQADDLDFRFALDATAKQKEVLRQFDNEDDETRWRRLFVPHAVVKVDATRPRSILSGMGPDPRVIKLDLAQGSASFLEQALAGTRKRITEGGGEIRNWGPAAGVVVNHSPDHAEVYDLDGNHIETLARAKRVGAAVLTLR